MPNSITVAKLPHAEHQGDWHDKPLKWVVSDGELRQKFATKADAGRFARLWRRNGYSYALRNFI